MDVKTALGNYESANDSLAAADGNLGSAQAKQTDAQAKLTAASQGVADAQKADSDAATVYNQSVDDLVTALSATKRTQSGIVTVNGGAATATTAATA